MVSTSRPSMKIRAMHFLQQTGKNEKRAGADARGII